jgi:hypothetical protein
MMPENGWLSEKAMSGLAELGRDDFAEAIAELRRLLADGDFQQEIGILALVAVRSPDELSEAIDGLVTLCCLWACTASARLDMGGIILLMVTGEGVKAGLRAKMN